MNKLLIAIVSCERDHHTHKAIRETWMTMCPAEVDVRFFMGKGGTDPDEINLNCDDSYEGLTEKALQTFEWILARGYTHVLHVGRDTYINVDNVLKANLWDKHYAGNGGGQHGWFGGFSGSIPNEKGRWNYASGGAGSWISAHAMRLILDSEIRDPADDLMFGWALGPHGIYLWDDPHFAKRAPYAKGLLTVHLSWGTGNYTPEWMYKIHKERLVLG